MSNLESNVAVMNGLFNNWSLINPSKDTVSATQNPARIHFTTRYYAYAPLRIHPFQISVRRQPEQFTPIQFGQVTKYLNDKGIDSPHRRLADPQRTTVLRRDNVRDTPGKPHIHTCGIRASSNVSIRPEDACHSTARKRGP